MTLRLLAVVALLGMTVPVASLAEYQLAEDLVLETGDDDAPLVLQIGAVAVDPQGFIHVADPGADCLHRFAPDGTYVARVGQAGEGPGDVMSDACLTVDRQGRVFIAGMGGRVDILDGTGIYLGGFSRENPANVARSIAVAADGTLAIAANNLTAHTVIDLYGPDHRLLRSIGQTFAAGSDVDPRFESCFAGGIARFDPQGQVVFLQFVPFALTRFALTGEVLRVTTAGGGEVVPMPPPPEIDGDTYHVVCHAGTSGLAVLPDGRALCSTFEFVGKSSRRSHLFLYDRNLALLASWHHDGDRRVVGSDGEGRVFQWVDERLVRYRVVADGR